MTMLLNKDSMINDIILVIKKLSRYDYVNKETIKNMLNNWAKNKEHIYKLFGDQLKVSAPIEFTYSESQIKKMVSEFTNKYSNPQYRLANMFINNILNGQEIMDNRLYEDVTILDTKFKVNTKIGRVLNKIIPKDYADKYITDFSMLIQSLKAKGEIILSIDPLDYLTMSENNSGWKSCHSLNSSYKTGGFAYMQDNCSIITYVKSPTPFKINDNLETSNKVWRQIMLLNPNLRYAVQLRQYPNMNKNNSQTAAKIIIGLLNQHHNRNDYVRKMYNMENDLNYSVLSNLCQDTKSAYHKLWYNDVQNRSFLKAFIIAPEQYNNSSDILDWVDKDYCFVGSKVYCLNCGTNTIKDSAFLYCDCCEDYEDYDDEI